MQTTIVTSRQVMVFGCVFTLVLATGCKSGMPSLNLFAKRGEPSPETLAGSGPTSTYPLPPSETASPEAIASVAGGVAPSGVSDSPAPGGGGPNLNLAAANANGFGSKPSGTKPTSAGVPAIPAGYQFGTNQNARVESVRNDSLGDRHEAVRPIQRSAVRDAIELSDAGCPIRWHPVARLAFAQLPVGAQDAKHRVCSDGYGNQFNFTTWLQWKWRWLRVARRLQ